MCIRDRFGDFGRSQVPAVERAGASAWRKVARQNAPVRTGALRRGIKTYKGRQGGYGIRSTDVKYGTVVHQGREIRAPFSPSLFFYRPRDPDSDIATAMKRKFAEQLNEMRRRSAILVGRMGPQAQNELRQRIARGNSKYGGTSTAVNLAGRADRARVDALIGTFAAEYTLPDVPNFEGD